MNKRKDRPLLDTKSVCEFMTNVLDIDPYKSAKNARLCVRIRVVEQLLRIYHVSNTKKARDFRDPRYYDESARQKLHERIIRELLGTERLDNEDRIRLGKGGALPRERVRREKKFFLVTGLPASGKSSIANKIADGSGAIIIDSDFAKRKFPEFKADYGASLVHEEAGVITEGPIADKEYKELSVLEMTVSQGFNVVMLKVCSTVERARFIFRYFKDRDYQCYLVHVELDRQKATKRALDRFVTSGRYVPLAMIYDEYSSDTTNAYHAAIRMISFLKGFIHLSTDVPRGKPPVLVGGRGCEEVCQWLNLGVHS